MREYRNYWIHTPRWFISRRRRCGIESTEHCTSTPDRPFGYSRREPNPFLNGRWDRFPSHMDGNPDTVVTYIDNYFGSVILRNIFAAHAERLPIYQKTGI